MKKSTVSPYQRSASLVYSSELLRGTGNGITRGATGQMSELGASENGAVACGELRKPKRAKG
ncbi:MAG TPA: hypothetical protein VFE51_05440, partial [Verrucomicrobiae bacterium]|nr:hypothetical protein [Verrucomicrobiae bacterium]